MAQSVTDLYRLNPSSQWLQFFQDLDVPNYYLTWSALVTTLLTLLLPEPLVLPAANNLANAFGVDEDSKAFLEFKYVPEITRAFRRVKLTMFQKLSLFLTTLKMTKKMVFAFSFQEDTFDIDLLTSPAVNKVNMTTVIERVKSLLTFIDWWKPSTPIQF